MFSAPTLATSAAVICAVSLVLLTKVVGRFTPLNCTTELLTKPVPLTISVNVPVPAPTVTGLIEVTIGTGFGGGIMVKVTTFDSPPPAGGVKTDTSAEPAAA